MGRIPGKNALTKIVSLILATVLWLYVTNEQNPSAEVNYQVALEVRNLAEDVVVLDAPEIVKVKLKGPRNLVAGVHAQDLKAYIDLKGLGDGKHTVQVALSAPPALESVEFNPDKISLRLDKIVAKELPVEIRVTGSLPPDTAVVRLTPNVERVILKGPKSILDAVRVFGTVDVKGHADSFMAEAKLVVLGSDGKEAEDLTPQPGKINVEVQLSQGKLKKLVDVKTVMTGEPAVGFALKSIQLKPEKVEIAGAPQLIESIDAVSTVPINLTDISKDVDKEIKLQLPEGVSAEKNTVSARISIIKKP